MKWGRLYRSRIDMFLQYWLTMKLRDEILTEQLFTRFRSFAAPELKSAATAAAFLRSLRHDADTYRDESARHWTRSRAWSSGGSSRG